MKYTKQVIALGKKFNQRLKVAQLDSTFLVEPADKPLNEIVKNYAMLGGFSGILRELGLAKEKIAVNVSKQGDNVSVSQVVCSNPLNAQAYQDFPIFLKDYLKKNIGSFPKEKPEGTYKIVLWFRWIINFNKTFVI